ncbi:SGNH/GDSL hydrolase family protein [Enterococcus sp. HY326]|uniref:SGNH/GDSL hydrolase family protein n=1 Tax=Enterococcus sp. HY326 TaxID=2971265 RepID=UPI00223EE1BD|nr:SGNH/GDSL hydrolase family protein [Enterococcus sp. HY326]
MFKKKERIVFVGDSITDAGRDYGAAPAAWSSWGEGFVNLINAYTTGLHPEKELMIINQGISGNRITDLKERWAEIMALQPDCLTIMIGVNDVWRQFDGTFMQQEQVKLDKFEKIYEELILESLEKRIKLVLLSAFMVEANQEDPMKKMLMTYNQITEKLADKYGLSYVDLQVEMDRFTALQSSYVLSADRVHPSLAGHVIIAKAWLQAVKLEG